LAEDKSKYTVPLRFERQAIKDWPESERPREKLLHLGPEGIDKPYFDKNGVIWLKVGADKRRVNSKEELRRLFQVSDQFHADELPTKAGPEKLDRLRFRDFLKSFYKQDIPETPEALERLLQSMNLATGDGRLNLAGVLLFAERPEWIVPQFVLKAVRYPGNEIHVSDYLDSEDFIGPLRKIFDDALAFILRNLHKVQAGRGVNAPGVPEIPPLVFEELLVNASATPSWPPMWRKGFYPTEDWAQVSNAPLKLGRKSISPTIGKDVFLPRRYTG